MSEFRLTGDYYVSEWNGDDANAGTDPNNPKQSVQSLPSSLVNEIVLGSGFYSGVWTGFRRIIGDGKVVYDFLGGNLPSMNDNHGNLTLGGFHNIHIKNLNTIQGSSGGVRSSHLVKCILDGVNNIVAGSNFRFYFSQCILLGQISMSANRMEYINSIVLTEECRILSSQFSFFSKNTVVFLDGNVTNSLNSNCINSVIFYLSNPYELKLLADGSPRPDADPLIPDLIDVFPNIYNLGNFAGEPKFLDVLNKIVSPDSDLFKRSNLNGFIGAAKAGRVIPVSTTEPNVTVTSERINTSDPQNWVIQTSEDDGWIDMKFRVSSQIVQCPVINFIAQLAFDGSVAGGTSGNNNVPDATPESYTPLSQPNLKPNRLVYLFRSSKSVNMPTTDAGWDNDGDTIGTPVIAGDFYAMEWSNGNRVAPFIRINGGVAYGNSNFEESGGAENFINVRWVNIRIRLTDLRSYA